MQQSVKEIVIKGLPSGSVQAGYLTTTIFCNYFMNQAFGLNGVVVMSLFAQLDSVISIALTGIVETISSSGIVPILRNMESFYSGWVENARNTEHIRETIDLETETGCVYLVHDDPETTKRECELLMLIEETYPNLFYENTSLFIPPENSATLTLEIMDILKRDPEALISDIISYYKSGSEENPIVPEELLNANP